MALQVEVLAAKIDDVSSIPRTHLVKGEHRLTTVILCPLYTCHRTPYVCVYKNTFFKNLKENKGDVNRQWWLSMYEKRD